MLIGLALALIGDTLGTKSRDPAATAQWLLLPQLIFGFLSVGIQPLHRFPDWIQPIVDNQPISRFVYAMQALAGDSGDGVRSGHLVGDRAGAGLGGRHHGSDAAVGCRGLPAEKLMAVLIDAAAVAERQFGDLTAPLLSQTGVLTRRLLVRSARTPMTLVHAVLLPVAFLLTLKVVFGDSITAVTGENALYRSVPLVALLATMSGSTTGMVGINAERLDGFLARLWSLPIHRAAGLLARLGAETVRLLVRRRWSSWAPE